MADKFAEYYSTPEKIEELSQYVHENMKVIATKMISEMRRKLNIEPDHCNSEGYISLMVSLQGRMFNELVYSLCGHCQAFQLKAPDVITYDTLKILVNLLQGNNVLNGLPRNDVKDDRDWYYKYYMPCIEELRSIVEALPK